MKLVAKYASGLWALAPYSTLYGLALLVGGVYLLITELTMPPISIHGLQPVLSPAMGEAFASLAILFGLVHVVQNIRTVHADIVFEAASPEEQNRMIARQLGISTDRVRRLREETRKDGRK